MPGFPFSDNQPVELVKSEDPKKVLEFVNKCISESNKHRNKFAILTGSYDRDTDKCDQLYQGLLYSERQKRKYECKPDDYAYYVDFNATLLRQFDYQETVKAVDEGESHTPEEALDSLSMTRLLKYCHKRNLSDEKEEDMLRFMGTHGNGIYEFQPQEVDGLAWPGHDTFHPKYFGISPGASDVDDAFFCFKRIPVPVAELKLAFKEHASQIQADKEISADDSTNRTNDGSAVDHVFSAIGNGARILANMASGDYLSEPPGNLAWLTKFYFRDAQIIKITTEEELDAWMEMNPAFGGDYFRQKARDGYLRKLTESMMEGGIEVKKFPFGRRIMTVNKIILEDVANPYPWSPFVNVKCYRRPKEAWAKGIVHKVREPIQNKQMLMAGAAANSDYRLRASYTATGNPSLANLKKIPMEPNTLTYLGQVGSKIEAVPVPPVAPQDIVNLSEVRRRDAEMTAGLESSLGGVNQTGTYSGVQYEKQLEQAIGKVAPRYRELTRGRQKIGEMYLWFIQNYMTDERKLDFLTQGEERALIQINQLKSVDGNPTVMNDVTKGKYNYFIEIGINRPRTTAERSRQAQEAAEIMQPFAPLLAVDLKLRSMDFPGKYELLEKFKAAVKTKEEQMAAQQQMQMQMEQKKLAIQANKNERELDVREIEAGAKAQEANSWQLMNLVKGLHDSGYEVPVDVLNAVLREVGLTANKMTQQIAGDKPGE
jgi:hypothetical protein